MQLQITSLDHSGFAVETEQHYFIFDYSNNSPLRGKKGIAGGAILPEELPRKPVFVFASHSHADHYTNAIFGWRGHAEGIHYILSDDISAPAHNDTLFVQANKEYRVEDVQITTLPSTDLGVAFLVRMGELCIYHAGDLNWWHWEGEPDTWNNEMGETYKLMVDSLAGAAIDVAFVPVDPRLNGQMMWGLQYLLQITKVSYAIPMHFWNKAAKVREAFEAYTPPGNTQLVPPMKRGERIVLNR